MYIYQIPCYDCERGVVQEVLVMYIYQIPCYDCERVVV